MSHESLNVQHIRDFLDYIEAEAMTSVHEQAHSGELHRDFVNALKVFIGKYHVSLPVIVAPSGISPSQISKMREGYLRDWRTHRAALQTLRPLFDLMLAVAEQQPSEEQSTLCRAAFPHGTSASQA
jgi:hypothetical protein